MKFPRKIIAGLIFISLLIINLSPSQEAPVTKVFTIHQNLNLQIDSRKSASFTPSLIAPYKEMDIFLSDIESSDFPFTTVGGYWEEIVPEGTNVKLEVKFNVNGSWTDWIEVEGEPDPSYTDETGFVKNYATASTNPAVSMQYRFLLYGDGIATPTVKNIDWTFINTAEESSNSLAPQPSFSSFDPLSNSTYISLTSSNDGVISRSQWGADESYRYLSSNDIDPVLIEIDPDYYEQFKDELQYSRVVEEDEDGDKYKWPLQYPEKVKKFIIHHTATTSNLDDPEQAIRDIYYYHAITRGWGDIGYNYILDQDGKVYEGRYGGEGVIGAHAGPGNNGSIGIAVLGNYEENEIPEKIIKALGKFISKKSKIHGINPEGDSLFRGQDMPNVFGHKDIMDTDCPGVHLYEKFPIIRSIAENYKEKQKEKFVKNYDYQDKSEIYYIELKPDETQELIFKLENIGKLDWNDKTYIVVDKNPDFEGVISFPGTDKIVTASMEEDLVKPGETATFKLKVKASKKSEIVNMRISPFMSGEKKSQDYMVIPVSVQQVDYKYEFIESKYPDKVMEKGQEFEGWVKLQNTGNITWRKSGENTVVLGTDHDKDRESPFVSAVPTRIGYLQEEEVKPGEIGTFSLKLKAPEESGYYKEYFTPIVEGVTWMADTGMYFETTVYGGLYEAELVSTSMVKEWMKGNKYLVLIKLRNLGKETWTKENMSVYILKELDLKVENASLANDEVPSGEIGTITFIAQVSADEKLEEKPLLVRPKVNGNNLLKRDIKLKYTVIDKAVAPDLDPNYHEEDDEDLDIKQGDEEQKDIRVKITFDDNPQITADGDFEIYNRTSLLTTLSSGEVAEISMANDKFTIETDDASYSKLGPIRFVPKANSILEIDNKDSYNQYRGILEIQAVDGALTVINELPLEDYMKGLGEEPNNEEYEKIKAVIIAARSYALYYIEKAEKFEGKPYNLDDSPATSQLYYGYGFEKNAPNVVKAVDETFGQVVTYDEELVKTPYFSKSDGTKTKSALEVWNWDAPYLVSVDDSYCDSDAFSGHGVGLSGCGAKGMAEEGFNYVEILKHYYTGVEITDLY